MTSCAGSLEKKSQNHPAPPACVCLWSFTLWPELIPTFSLTLLFWQVEMLQKCRLSKCLPLWSKTLIIFCYLFFFFNSQYNYNQMWIHGNCMGGNEEQYIFFSVVRCNLYTLLYYNWKYFKNFLCCSKWKYHHMKSFYNLRRWNPDLTWDDWTKIAL